MKTRHLVIVLLILILGFVFCGKDATGPEPSGPEGSSAFTLLLHNIAGVAPNFVQVMFQVLDGDVMGKPDLVADDFTVLEDGDQVTSVLVQNSTTIDYQLKTFLVIDNAQGTDLSTIKNAAGRIINGMLSNQSIAILALGDEDPFYYDFSDNMIMLSGALLTMESGGTRRNLFGCMYDAFTEYQNVYTSTAVEQYSMVLITSGADNRGAETLQDAQKARGNSAVWTIGVGPGISLNDLEQLGNVNAIHVNSYSELSDVVGNVQEQLASYSDGFYSIKYSSDSRGSGNHTVDISLLENTNTDEDASFTGPFNSANFYSVENGLYVNLSERFPSGFDTVWVMTGDDVPLNVLTSDPAETPDYTWQSNDPGIVSVDVNAVNSSIATITAVGANGQNTTLIIDDMANGAQKTLTVMVVDYLAGSILREWWEEMPGGGTGVSELIQYPDYPDNPTDWEYISTFECPTSIGDNYGTRVRGYLVPPVSGEYIFWVASDDNGQLWLSPDKNPNHAELIASVPEWTNSREWGKYPEQQSDPISLVGGEIYYIEALAKDATGGDNLGVAWQGPGIDQTIIDGTYLGPVIKYK